MPNYKIEMLDLHGGAARPHEVYAMAPAGPDYWPAVTSYDGAPVGCPVQGCAGRIVWHEAGYVPGYRRCDGGAEHRFQAAGTVDAPTLIRDHEWEPDAEAEAEAGAA